MEGAGTAHGLKERAMEELKVYWIVTLYLWVFLGLFTVYRRLVVAETGASYLHYGIALIEALVIAKVVLIGKMFGFSRRFEDRALIVPVIYKSVLFGLLVLLFGVVEHLVVGWFHRQGLLGGLARDRLDRRGRTGRAHADADRGLRPLLLVLRAGAPHRRPAAGADVLLEPAGPAGACAGA